MSAKKSLRESILASKVPGLKSLHVPEWEQTVYLKQYTFGDAWDYERYVGEGKSGRLVMLILALCDEAGKPIFGIADYDAMLSLDKDVVMRVSDAIHEYN